MLLIISKILFILSGAKMVEEGPNNKAEIQEIFRRLRQSPANRVSYKFFNYMINKNLQF